MSTRFPAGSPDLAEPLDAPLAAALHEAALGCKWTDEQEYDACPGPQHHYMDARLVAGQLAACALVLVLDGPPGPDGGRFVDVETADGRSVMAAAWRQRDGLWRLGPFFAGPEKEAES